MFVLQPLYHVVGNVCCTCRLFCSCWVALHLLISWHLGTWIYLVLVTGNGSRTDNCHCRFARDHLCLRFPEEKILQEGNHPWSNSSSRMAGFEFGGPLHQTAGVRCLGNTTLYHRRLREGGHRRRMLWWGVPWDAADRLCQDKSFVEAASSPLNTKGTNTRGNQTIKK